MLGRELTVYRPMWEILREKLRTVEQKAEQFQESVTKENTQLKTELTQLKEEIERERKLNTAQLTELSNLYLPTE